MHEIKSDTIIRTAILIVALINQVLVSCGKPVIQFDNELFTELANNLFTIGAAVWSWWKNNSFTEAAIIADEEMHRIKGK